MHAYLIVGASDAEKKEEILRLSKKLGAKRLDFLLSKIEDVRSLNSLTALTLSEATVVVSENIDAATEEAQNAFLKNLEEPQENLFYLLTATSEQGVLPTIASRCQLIRTKTGEQKVEKKAIEFLKKTTAQQLIEIDAYRKREDALPFVEEIIFSCHSLLHKNPKSPERLAKFIEAADEARRALKGNGNPTLTLANMVFGLV